MYAHRDLSEVLSALHNKDLASSEQKPIQLAFCRRFPFRSSSCSETGFWFEIKTHSKVILLFGSVYNMDLNHWAAWIMWMHSCRIFGIAKHQSFGM